MKVRRVTFSGVDDTVTPQQLAQFVDNAPDVPIEWGILLSKSNQGRMN